MRNELLDKKIVDLKSLKSNLNQAGLTKHFEEKNNTILVQESDTIQVKIFYDENFVLRSKAVFPQIGNVVQIIATIVLLGIFFYFGLSSLLVWVVAILGGQIISLLVHLPKINKLKAKVDEAIS